MNSLNDCLNVIQEKFSFIPTVCFHRCSARIAFAERENFVTADMEVPRIGMGVQNTVDQSF